MKWIDYMDTNRSLTLEESGVFSRMVTMCQAGEGFLPSDEGEIAAIIGIDRVVFDRAFRRLRAVNLVCRFEGGGWGPNFPKCITEPKTFSQRVSEKEMSIEALVGLAYLGELRTRSFGEEGVWGEGRAYAGREKHDAVISLVESVLSGLAVVYRDERGVFIGPPSPTLIDGDFQ